MSTHEPDTRVLGAASSGLFQCGTCMRKYKRLDHLARHVRSRESSLGHLHEQCGLECSILHKRYPVTKTDDVYLADTQTKPFQCPICNKAFART